MVFATGDCHGNYQRFKARYFPEQHTMDRSDYTIFTMGGASSHDIQDGILNPDEPDFKATVQWLQSQGRRMFRVLGRSWWPEELPSEEEYQTALETLERVDWKVDYVITHCAPTSVAQLINRDYQSDALTDFLDMVNQRLDFHYWLFGHYHDNQNLTDKHVLLWEQIVQVL